MKLRFSIRDLLILVLASAVGLATFKAYWDPSLTNTLAPLSNNYELVLAVYLCLLAVMTLCCWRIQSGLKNFSAAYSVFGWVYFVCVLRGGFGDLDFSERWGRARYSLMGIGFALVAGLLGYLTVRLASATEKSNE